MSDTELIAGLKQLKLNIEACRKLHHAKGLDIKAPYTRNTEDMLKIVFVNQLLEQV